MPKTGVEHAYDLWDHGFTVLPVEPGEKLPSIAWKRYQTERPSRAKTGGWFKGRQRNYFILTGTPSMCVVVDCDNEAAVDYWRGQLGDVLDTTTAVKTSKGYHFYFRLLEGQVVRNASHHEGGVEWDIRGDGGGVVVPPSVHESGHEYQWLLGRGPEAMEVVPEALLRGENGAEGGEAGVKRSMLAELLANPPSGTGGRNDWLARVAGHYAANCYPNLRDLYDVQCRLAYDMLDQTDFDEAEYNKTIESIWQRERDKGTGTYQPPSEDNGWLISAGTSILVEIPGKDGGDTRLENWADFDIEAVGVVEDDDAQRVYDVLVHRSRQGDTRPGLLPAKDLADNRRLAGWLAEFGVTILPPPGDRRGAIAARLQRYIENQKPTQFMVVDNLGWHDSGFVVHEGVITTAGLQPHGRVKPHPRLRNWAPYRYGFAPEAKAAEVLREVLTFHDETVTAVFGAWWAACLLKPQIHQVTSQFPFMALQAPSESGKTTGFFSMMVQLSGNAQGQVNLTRAALRDSLSAHKSGIVWIDDLDNVDHLTELLRQGTGEGSVGKKSEDRTGQEMVQLVAPIVVSGESLGLGGQKALMDRAVKIDVPSPTQRKSLKDSGRLQWADILEFRNAHPDLTRYSGTIVQAVLNRADMVADLPSYVPEVGGRFGDKIAIVRFGARILGDIVGGDIADRVDAWAGVQEDAGSENTLTLKLIPEALRRTSWPTRPELAEGRWPATPVFVQGDEVWFSPQHLAAWWNELNHGRVLVRVESEEAILEQARALGLGGTLGTGRSDRRRFKLSGDPNRKSIYWRLDTELGHLCMSRSRGEVVSQGIHPEQKRLDLLAYTYPYHEEDPT